jgi:hypothetical protein
MQDFEVSEENITTEGDLNKDSLQDIECGRSLLTCKVGNAVERITN